MPILALLPIWRIMAQLECEGTFKFFTNPIFNYESRLHFRAM